MYRSYTRKKNVIFLWAANLPKIWSSPTKDSYEYLGSAFNSRRRVSNKVRRPRGPLSELSVCRLQTLAGYYDERNILYPIVNRDSQKNVKCFVEISYLHFKVRPSRFRRIKISGPTVLCVADSTGHFYSRPKTKPYYFRIHYSYVFDRVPVRRSVPQVSAGRI